VLKYRINSNIKNNMGKIRAAVVGYGNIGKFTLEALEAASDFEVAGIVRRNGAENKPAELANYPVVKDIKELENVDVAILATPTRSVEKYAKEILALGINTVDSFDIHTQITDFRNGYTCRPQLPLESYDRKATTHFSS
jgi:diaminopimelate dehydrogenase